MKIKKIALFVTTTLALFTAVPRVSADSNVQKVIDETYVKPDYVLGYSLDQSQIEQTLSLLNYDSSKDKEEWKTMTPEVYSSIMNVANDDSLELYSSVKIQKLGKNKPLEVNIVTPQNITKPTEVYLGSNGIIIFVQFIMLYIFTIITIHSFIGKKPHIALIIFLNVEYPSIT